MLKFGENQQIFFKGERASTMDKKSPSRSSEIDKVQSKYGRRIAVAIILGAVLQNFGGNNLTY